MQNDPVRTVLNAVITFHVEVDAEAYVPEVQEKSPSSAIVTSVE